MTKNLVIVESPAKAETLSRILGAGYRVLASYGHVRDLPESADEIPAKLKKEAWARLGVDVDHGFEPLYVVSSDKKRHIRELKKALAGADELLLATDEDREGESISWHVVELLKPTIPSRRIVFHEITEEAILAALEAPRAIDLDLVQAQESRRIIDRLFGYQLSPLLWKKVASGLSAGRVQSVAVRLCVMRERERRSFVSAGYWGADAELTRGDEAVPARWSRLGERRLATGQDFDADTGEPKNPDRVLWLRTEQEVRDELSGRPGPWKVTSVDKRPLVRRPAPPFTTSTLQQEANRKLRFSARQTMSVAQRLYEGIDIGSGREGLITYMRTDSVHLSNKALGDATGVIRDLYGPEYHGGPRHYANKTPGAQEAHEAIRPTEVSRRPEELRRHLRSDELRLYELIWKRMIASQMANADLLRTSVEITAEAEAEGREPAIFAASGTAIRFPGFLRAYVEGSDDPAAEIADREVLLPELSEGDRLEVRSVEPRGSETQPPARYTEASLVKKLEAEGIGRPSTYATIIDTIQERGYVRKERNALIPTFTGLAVTELLEKHFRDYVDTTFTARMESQLDDIAEGHLNRDDHLRRFYFGGDGDSPGLQERIEREGPEIDYPAIEIGRDPASDAPVIVKIGRFGPYVQVEGGDGNKISASIPPDTAPADFTLEQAHELLRRAQEGARPLGADEASGETVYLAHGRFGAYVQLGETPEKGSKGPKPKRASLPKGQEEDGVTLEMALKWLSLPRTLGVDETTGEEILAMSGRYGPYVKCGKETRSLTDQDDVYEVGLARARELLAQPKGRGRQRAAPKVIRQLGKDSGGNAIELRDGRWGPYLTNGEVNASLPKAVDPAGLDEAAARKLLAERGKAPKGRRGKSRSRKK